ncbi:maestro heat-like repeat-containing protein family member 6, partial [Agelaius tricolor]|uniref:maestro heat-like repeat-containing protein family member 6 n=1 Tax=Agelaius tricolor TaxID=9191 RepID=UPI0039F23C8B
GDGVGSGGGRKPLAKVLSQSLLPLFFQCHDEKRCVAKASRETLLGVAKFLKRRKLKQLVKKGQLSKFSEVLLAEDRSRAAEHLRGALRYLQSPQEPLREAAVRIIGMAGMVMRGRKEELQLLNEALQGLRRDDSPSQRNIALQQRIMERSAELRLSGGSEEPLLLKGLKTPWKRRSPGETRRDQERPAGASGTADDWHS